MSESSHPETVFVLQHLRSEEDSEDQKLIGVYSSRNEAEAAVGRKSELPGFSNFPRIIDPLNDEEGSGFYIDELQIDRDYWSGGFGEGSE